MLIDIFSSMSGLEYSARNLFITFTGTEREILILFWQGLSGANEPTTSRGGPARRGVTAPLFSSIIQQTTALTFIKQCLVRTPVGALRCMKRGCHGDTMLNRNKDYPIFRHPALAQSEHQTRGGL